LGRSQIALSKNNFGENQRIEIWFGVADASAGTAVSIALSGDPEYNGVADICEYSGVLTVAYLDKTASTFGTSAASATGTTDATTQDSELWIGGTHVFGEHTQDTPTNGFTLLDGATVHGAQHTSLAYLEKIVNASAAASSGTTISASDAWTGVIATFKASAPAGVTVKKGSSLVNTMAQMLNSKMLYSAVNRFPKLTPRTF